MPGTMARSREYSEQAFAFDRPGFRVRAGLDYGRAYYLVTGELDKAIDATRLGIRNYPQRRDIP